MKLKILLLLIVLFSLLHTGYFHKYITDDAFISYRYLENMIDGNGLVYNSGEKVWGYTNFLWIMILFPFVKLGGDSFLVSRLLGIMSNMLVLVFVIRGFQKKEKGQRNWNITGALLLASTGAFVMQALNGLETSLFTLLILSAIFIFWNCVKQKSSKALYSLGLVMALSTLARPEGVFFFGIIVLNLFLCRRILDLQIKTILSKLIMGYLPIVLVFEVLMYSYYGVFWPNSIKAKVGLSFEQILRGIRYFQVFITRYPVCLIPIILTVLFFKRAGPMEKLILQFSVFVMCFNIAVGGDWMLGYRLFHVLIPLSCLLVPFCLDSLKQSIVFMRGRPAFLAVVVALFSLLAIAPSFFDSHVYRGTRQSYVHDGVKIGKWIKVNISPDSLLATNTGGTIAYYSGLPIVDMMGINDTVIAGRKNLPREWKGIEKGDGEYVLSRRPDYIQFGSSTGRKFPAYLSDIEIYQSEDFWNHYRLVSFNVDEETKLILYKRRRKIRSKPLPEARWDIIKKHVEKGLQRSAFRY